MADAPISQQLADLSQRAITELAAAEARIKVLEGQVTSLELKVKAFNASKQKKRADDLEAQLLERDQEIGQLRVQIERDRVAAAGASSLQARLNGLAERLGVSQAGHSALSLLSAVEDAIRKLLS